MRICQCSGLWKGLHLEDWNETVTLADGHALATRSRQDTGTIPIWKITLQCKFNPFSSIPKFP